MVDMNSEIYFSKIGERKKFVKKIMKKFSKEMKDKNKIFIKPNIVSYEPYPTTTHPDVLREVLCNLPKKSEIVVGDACVPDSPVTIGFGKKDVIKNHPLSDVCKEFGLELKNLYEMGFKRIVTSSGFSLMISKVALESDYMISLPITKTHCCRSIGITGALKNNFGLLAAKERIILHSSGSIPLKGLRIITEKIFGADSEKYLRVVRKMFGIKKEINLAIAELNKIRKPDLFIIDMIETLINANEVRHGGVKAHTGYMFAGKDPVALDCFGFEILKKIDPILSEKKWYEIPSIYYARKIGVGNEKFKLIEVI
ncbi:MAG: DUF362 domain-containing protein [Candidatus Aenigmatarchaeota archaeon]